MREESLEELEASDGEVGERISFLVRDRVRAREETMIWISNSGLSRVI